MIRKYRLGNPIKTDSVVIEIETESESIPFFEINEGFILTLMDKDIVCGLGENVRGINKRGWKYTSYNLDNCHHQEDTVSLYGAHNFLLISGEKVFGLFFDYPGKMDYDIGYTRRDTIRITAESYDMDIYLIEGNDELEVITQLRKLTGQSYIAPMWAFGYGQSRWGYKSADDIREVARNYRENNIPIDSIYLDIDYMDHYKDFTINNETFPKFKEFCQEMKDQGIHLVPIIDAGVKIEKGYEVYEEGVANDYFCKDEEGRDFIAAVWPGRVHFPDMLNSKAREWFGNKYSVLLDCGIEGFWNDMNEPSIFYTDKRLQSAIDRVVELGKMNIGISEYFELQGVVNSISHNPGDHKEFYHNMDGQLVRHDKVHNLFGGSMTKAASEAFKRLCPEKKILMFSRSSYIGAHRYGGIWQGDNSAWWSHLLMNIQMTASLNMIGFLYTGADSGGFCCDTTEDLMVRWLQWSMFTPLMRNHSAMGTREQEVYRFANMQDCKKMIEIRYALIPYLYDTYLKAVENDSVMIKPLWFDFKDDMSRQVEDQVLVGNELMVTPVYTQNARGRYVYLPEEMTEIRMKSVNDIRTKKMSAGHYYIDFAMDEMVFFLRKNARLPLCSGGINVASIDTENIKYIE